MRFHFKLRFRSDAAPRCVIVAPRRSESPHTRCVAPSHLRFTAITFAGGQFVLVAPRRRPLETAEATGRATIGIPRDGIRERAYKRVRRTKVSRTRAKDSESIRALGLSTRKFRHGKYLKANQIHFLSDYISFFLSKGRKGR